MRKKATYSVTQHLVTGKVWVELVKGKRESLAYVAESVESPRVLAVTYSKVVDQ